jgi:GTP-binding protein era
MVNVAERTLKDVDVILWLVEASDYIGAGEQHILEVLSEIKKPVILAINKMDALKNQDEVLLIMEKFSKLRDFTEIVPVSALKGVNTGELLKVLYQYLPEGPLYYDEDTVTDQPMRQIAAELIREKALRLLKDEIPHGIAVEIDKMSTRKGGLTDIEATIVCERDSHKGIVIGKGGAMLKRIGTAARKDIEDMMEGQVNLKLWVKVRKEWRDSDIQMKNFGYNPKDI